MIQKLWNRIKQWWLEYKEYQKSKALWMKLHRYDDCKLTQKDHIKNLREAKKIAKRSK